MATSTTHIRVPVELHAKLKELARIRGGSMVELLHALARDAEAKGELSPDVSTFQIALDLDREPARIVLSTREGVLADLTPADTVEFADKLESVARRGGNSYVAQETFQTQIGRVGTGIVLERQDPIPDPAAPIVRRSLTPAFAEDLAARLRAAVA